MVERIALLSVHTSPLAALGGKKTGGMNVYVRELAQELARQGVLVDIYTRRYAPELPEVDESLGAGVRVIYLTAGPSTPLEPMDIYPYLQQFTSKLVAFTIKHGLRYDLIYSHYWLSGRVAYSLKEMWGTPFVHMFHTLGHMKNRLVAHAAPIADERTRVETQITQWADRIIAATPAEQTQLRWLYRADRRKIAVVPPGVNTERFHLIPQDEAKAALGIEQDTNLLLFVGRIEPLKAVDTILEAISLIQETAAPLLEHTRFAIIGGDPDQPDDGELSRLMEMTQQLDLGNIVTFLGAKQQALLPNYYAAATAVIMPSDYESFGMVALEAMATGAPVIATEVGGLPYVVRDGETGYLVPVRDPSILAERIASLLADPTTQQRMRGKAAEVAQGFAWSHIAHQLLPIFDELARKRTAAQV